MATKISVYRTRDNQMFDNEVDANLHETTLELTSALINKGVTNDGNLREACHQLAKHYSTFEPLLVKLKALNKRKMGSKINLTKSEK